MVRCSILPPRGLRISYRRENLLHEGHSGVTGMPPACRLRPDAARQAVSGADRLRQAEPPCAGEDKRDRRLKAHAMANRDEHRPHVCARADDGADEIAAVKERRPVASVGSRLFVRADQPRLGDADCGQVKDKAQMARDADPPRVRDPLPIAHQDIRLQAQRPDGGHRCRPFAKAEQAGHVRKRRRNRSLSLLQWRQRREIEQYGRGMGRTAAPSIGDIDAGHRHGWCETVSALDLAPKPGLQRNRVCNRPRPRCCAGESALVAQGCSRRNSSGGTIQLMNQAPVTVRRTRQTAVPGTKSTTSGCSLPSTRRETNRLMNG